MSDPLMSSDYLRRFRSAGASRSAPSPLPAAGVCSDSAALDEVQVAAAVTSPRHLIASANEVRLRIRRSTFSRTARSGELSPRAFDYEVAATRADARFAACEVGLNRVATQAVVRCATIRNRGSSSPLRWWPRQPPNSRPSHAPGTQHRNASAGLGNGNYLGAPMPLGDFIERHHDEIIGEFSAFARTLILPSSHLTETDLRDHAQDMLTAIAQDLRTEQSADEQSEKAKGHGVANLMAISGRLHAEGRIEQGFTPGQVLAEFRALRASVLRLYERFGQTDIGGVTRFNEAIDEVLTESMTRYAAKTDLYRDQFIGILSHDLRSPLSAITAGAALMAASASDDQRQARVAARILNSAQRMERMIGDLLDLTRTRLGGAIPLKRVPTDLQQVCDEVLLEVQAAQPDAVVRFRVSGDVSGEWDPDRLAQVVSNLLGNAIHHGGGGPISLEAHGADESVTLGVHNVGNPIPPATQGMIFEPLARGASDDATHRIGLGLFIARAIVSAHGGEIRVRSAEGEGTTFEVLLPRRATLTNVQEAGPVPG